jgi:hypothetical protein
MADDNKISFLLDLDVADFTEKGLQAKGIIEQLGGADNISGLIEGLTTAGVILGTVGVAAFAFKKAIDLTTEGEEIERVNKQFETLATQAGIAPDKLKAGLENASHGLISTTDLLKIANEGIVKMGGSAEKLPQIMDIAMKATQVYGGDAKTNFENISNAIANGNTRMLKHYGIIIDATKAEKDFADANGTTADQLSQTGKNQAILNAALAQGTKAFKDIELNTKSATSILQSLKTTFTEIGETVTLVFEKTVGPKIRSFLGTVEGWAKKFHVLIKDEFEGGANDATKSLQKVNAQTKQNEKDDVLASQAAMNREKLRSQNLIVDQEKAKKNQQAFRKELEKIDKDYYNQEQQNISSLAQVEKLVKKQSEMAEKDHITRIQAIENNASLTRSQKKRLEHMEDQRYSQEREAMTQQEEKLREKLLDNYLSHSKNVYQGITRAAQLQAVKARAELKDFGKMGQQTMTSFSQYSTQAFEQMGQAAVQGSDMGQAAAQAMKALFLNVLADRAIQTGSVMLLEGIWPPNPLALGAGAGLIALGGALRTLAGGTGTTVGGATGGGVGTSGIGVVTQPASPLQSSGAATTDTGAAASSTATADMSQQTPQRTVQVNIAGNYLETDSTKRMLMDLMRQESDATGFSYNQIGA